MAMLSNKLNFEKTHKPGRRVSGQISNRKLAMTDFMHQNQPKQGDKK
jgi:hypothetical protein